MSKSTFVIEKTIFDPFSIHFRPFTQARDSGKMLLRRAFFAPTFENAN